MTTSERKSYFTLKESDCVGMYMMVKKACTCGEIDELELCAKSEPKLCYFVRCPRCGRTSAKHREPEEAVKDWNHMEDRADDC